MSNNTNTLFWVITGAVIVLAVFILINSSQNESIKKINNKFDSMWNNLIVKDEHSNIEWAYDYTQYQQINACGTNKFITPDNKIELTSHYLVYDYGYNILQGYFVKNISNETIINKLLDTDIYNCSTGEIIVYGATSIEYLEPGQEKLVYMTGGYSNGDFEYYMQPYLKEWN